MSLVSEQRNHDQHSECKPFLQLEGNASTDEATLVQTVRTQVDEDLTIQFNWNSSSKDMQKELVTHTHADIGNIEETILIESRFYILVEKIEGQIRGFVTKHGSRIRQAIYTLMLLLYLSYFGYCMNYRFGDEGSIVLLVITVFMLLKVFFKVLNSRGIVVSLPRSFYSFANSKRGLFLRKIVRYLLYLGVPGAIISYLTMEVFLQNPTNLQAFLGMLALLFLCFVFSAKPSRVNWHPVFWAFSIQFAVAFITLRTEFGYNAFKWLGNLVHTLFSFSKKGSAFVIGENFHDWGLALKVSGNIIFTNAFIFLMTQWGVIEFIVLKLGGFLAFCLETGPVESVVASANIFIGLAEAPLMVRPYLPSVTKSELHTIITCGFASVSGGSMAFIIAMGAPANHLLTAAVISAPAALAISKLMYPETERVCHESQRNVKMVDKKQSNSLNAYSEGAVLGLTICGAVWSNMLAFLSMIGLMDAIAGWFGERAGVEVLTFGLICSYVLFPLAYLMGVHVSDCRKVGELIGIKLFATPVVGYQQLGYLIENREIFENYLMSSNNTSWYWEGDNIFLEATNTTLVGGIISERTEVIATYAMCGHSAFTAIGICLGALVPICPSRKQDIVDVIMRAFIAGNVASFSTGAIAGLLQSRHGIRGQLSIHPSAESHNIGG